MPSNVFFFDGALEVGSTPILEGEEFHHAKSVMRVKEGETISVLNGKGVVANAVVQAIQKIRMSLVVQSVVKHPSQEKELVLGVSLLRPGHLDYVVEKGVEVGVDRFLLFPAEASERKECFPNLQRRLKALAISALKQSGRVFLPELCYCDSLSESLGHASRPIVWADLLPEAKPLSVALARERERKAVTIYVGPEAGWSEKEKKLLIECGPPIWLHDTILRAETAGIIGAYVGFCWLKGIHGSI